jgi:hypothetical protein
MKRLCVPVMLMLSPFTSPLADGAQESAVVYGANPAAWDVDCVYPIPFLTRQERSGVNRI